jgi:hypothetical protein
VTENLLLVMKLAAAVPAEIERVRGVPDAADPAVVSAARQYVARQATA